MLQDANLVCDICNGQISLAGKTSVQLLIELVKEGPDRHYCESCMEQARSPKRDTMRPDEETDLR
jgi:hypothetical protein